MIRTRESIAVFSLMAVFACSSAAGTEPNDANMPLTFEVSPTVLPAPPLLRRVRAIQSPWEGTVTHAAGVARNHSPWFPSHGSSAVHSFIRFAQSQDISEEQRRFLETTYGGLQASHSGGRDPHTLPDFYTRPEDPDFPQLLLYAVSLDDARKMAEAYLQFARDRFEEQIVPKRAEIKGLSEKLAAEQQKLPEAGQAEETAKKAFEAMEKQVPYRDDKQALDAAAELDKMLNTSQVEIAGIQATLTAIRDHLGSLSSSSSNAAVRSKLEVMFVEESVSLKAAEARKRMATTLRKQADGYIDLKATWQQAETEKARLTHGVSVLPEMIKTARQKLAEAMEREPKIVNDKVFIYPLKQ